MIANYWFILIPIGIIISLFIKWISDTSKDFTNLIETELSSKNMKLIRLTYPGLLKVGPFKKFEVSIGKPQINDGMIQYEKTYYRIVELKTKNNKTKKVWTKIETNWFKESQIEFKPKLSELNQKNT